MDREDRTGLVIALRMENMLRQQLLQALEKLEALEKEIKTLKRQSGQ